MIRVVVNKEGEIFADVTGKKQGRGAYVSKDVAMVENCLLYTSPSPRDYAASRMPSSA
ncbi:hypothetical protein JMUB7523_26580 [Staphylococcus aureus]